jgi:hypothetical protein
MRRFAKRIQISVNSASADAMYDVRAILEYVADRTREGDIEGWQDVVLIDLTTNLRQMAA